MHDSFVSGKKNFGIILEDIGKMSIFAVEIRVPAMHTIRTAGGSFFYNSCFILLFSNYYVFLQTK